MAEIAEHLEPNMPRTRQMHCKSTKKSHEMARGPQVKGSKGYSFLKPQSQLEKGLFEDWE